MNRSNYFIVLLVEDANGELSLWWRNLGAFSRSDAIHWCYEQANDEGYEVLAHVCHSEADAAATTAD